nr:M56 family metallopeptidase [uncultured Sulfurimonas sp.]
MVSFLLTLSNRFVPVGLTIILQTTVIIAGGLFVRKLIRKRNAAFQSAVLRATLVVVLISPLVSLLIMHLGIFRIQIPMPELTGESRQMYEMQEKITQSIPGEITSVPAHLPAKRMSGADTAQNPSVKNENSRTLSQLQPQTHYNSTLNRTDNSSEKTPFSRNTESVDAIAPGDNGDAAGNLSLNPIIVLKVLFCVFTVLWIMFSIYYLLKSIIVSLCIVYIRQTASHAQKKYITLCNESAALLNMAAPPVLQHPVVRGTFVCGFFKPAIVLPYGTQQQFMATREVMLHELAHLARQDNLWNMVCQIVLILMPVQPLVSTLMKKISEVNDFACDDYVLTYGGNSKAYATQLFNISKTYSPGIPEAAIGSGIISNSSPLYERIERILDTTYIRIIKVRAFEIFSVIVFSFSSISLTGFVGFNGNHTNGNGKRKHQHFDEQYIERVITHVPANNLYQMTSIGDDETASGKLTRKNEPVRPETRQKTGKTVVEESNDYETISTGVSNADVVNNSLAVDSSPATVSDEPPDLTKNIHDVNLQQANEPVINTLYAQELTKQTSEAQNEADNAETGEFVEGRKESEVVFENADELQTPEITVDIAQIYSNTMSSSAISNENNSNTVLKVIDIVINYDFDNADLTDPEQKELYNMYLSLDNNKFYPVWSLDGNNIIISDKSYGIWRVPVQGGEPELIYRNEPVQYDNLTIRLTGIEPLCFSPGGQELTYKRYIIDEDMGTEVIVDNTTTPTSVTILNPVPVIETVDIETGRTQVLAKGAAYGRWNYDGSMFMYTRLDADSFKELMIRNVITGDEYPIDEFEATRMQMSPNDRYLMFNEDDIFMMPGTGGLKRFTVGKEVIFSDVSRDGHWILYTYQNSLYVYDTHKEEIIELYTARNTSPSWARFSPDLTGICFSLKNQDSNWQIYLYDFSEITETTNTAEEAVPVAFELKENFPNPFNISTTIQFTLPERMSTSMVIYNSMGQKVRELVSGELESGVHNFVWDGRNDKGLTAGTGLYIAQLISGKYKATVKLTMVK